MRTTIRAAIMLTVLVGLPAAWLYYGPLPPQVQRVVDRLVDSARESLGWSGGEAVDQASKVPPRFDPNFQMATHETPLPGGERLGEGQPSTGSFGPSPGPALRGRGTASGQIEPLLAQLRAMGASEYYLEHWGTGGLLRFRCEMPLAEGTELTRQFEAVAADQQEAIRKVVEEVAAWHRERQPTTPTARPQSTW